MGGSEVPNQRNQLNQPSQLNQLITQLNHMDIIRKRAYARAGLLG